MGVQYVAVGWNRQKKIYDATLIAGVLLYLAIFVTLGALAHPNATAETLLIRGLGTCAFLLLHITLCIGPLCRVDSRFLPLLYNRRHLGVTTFLLGAGHGVFAIIQFHALGDTSPLVSLFVSNRRYDSLSQFPFETLGFAALVILFVMAATSHDFWLRNLTAPTWKRLHMLVYLAYALLVTHVALGALQSEHSPIYVVVLTAGVSIVCGLHLAAAIKTTRLDRQRDRATADGFVQIGKAVDIPDGRATIRCLSGERVAIFRNGQTISAVSNVCQHQNGPLGEGRILKGCIVCPWHGYEYRPETGASPPPFKEKIPTFTAKVIDGMVFVHPQPHAPGTYVSPAQIDRLEVEHG
jgi:DMSO/TMAO reductase YedYZ heme-binding membrane subunit/nitrite reductase/ring-hydroxylating ferredoxin subunit